MGLLLGAIAWFAPPASAQIEGNGPHSPAVRVPAKKSGLKFGFSAELSTKYDTNPMHATKTQLRRFDSLRSFGERFHGLESKSDSITTLTLDGSVKKKLGKGRSLRGKIGVDRHQFLLDNELSYTKLRTGVDFDLTKRDSVSADLKFVPRRKRKNLRRESTGLFEGARFNDFEFETGYSRQLTKRWSAGLSYRFDDRQYRASFNDRDRRGHSIALRTKGRLIKNLYLDFEVEYGFFNTKSGHKVGVRIDRSFDQVSLSPGLRVKAGEWNLRGSIEYRRREYTSDSAGDPSHFDRTDKLFNFKIQAEKKIFDGSTDFSFFATWRRNRSDRSISISSDDTDYRQYTVGIAFVHKF